MAQVVAVLWVIPANTVLPLVLFNIGTQINQHARMQVQIVQLENQYNWLQEQENGLKKQSIFLQRHANDGTPIAALFTDLAQTTDSLVSYTNDTSQYVNARVNYTIKIYALNGREMEDDTQIQRTQDAIDVNEQELAINQKGIATLADAIKNNNTILSAEEYVQPPVWIEQQSCVRGYPCSLPGWQQSFATGWRHISTRAFSTTWFFWLLLVSSLTALFFLLPFSKSKSSSITYRVLYNGTLMQLNDAGFPTQKRQELGGETQILKVEIRPTFLLKQKKGLPNETQAFLHLVPDGGTTIQDVFLKENKKSKRRDPREVRYDKTTNSIILSMQPIPLKEVKRLPPMQIYAVVDYFTGTLKAQTPVLFSWVECVQELRGPLWLLRVGNFLHGISWWIYGVGAYMSLSLCSYYFFDDVVIFPAKWIIIGLIALAIAVFLTAGEVILMHKITRPQSTAYGQQI